MGSSTEAEGLEYRVEGFKYPVGTETGYVAMLEG